MNENTPRPGAHLPHDLPEDVGETYNPLRSGTPAGTDAPGAFAAHSPDSSVLVQWRVANDGSENPTLALPEEQQPTAPADGNAAYRLKRVIASGGFGDIWEATQGALNRPVAVKKLRADLAEIDKSGTLRRRYENAFREEALTTARLEHPNIVPVHDLGVDEHGNLLLAMKLVRGQPWEELLYQDRDRLSVSEFLAKHLSVLIDVGQAVAFAHSRGIVHRDLKPAQVMVGEFGEVLLMDWGIAMVFDPARAEPAETLSTGARLPVPRGNASNPAGTVAYMAPEQTEETPRNIGPWTDVYLLGGILYELVTGKKPHHAPDQHAAFFQAAAGDIVDPVEAAGEREVPAELAALARHALQPRPADRPPGAEYFVRELRAFLTGETRRREAAELVDEVERLLAPGEDAGGYGNLAEGLNKITRALILTPDSRRAGGLREQLLGQYARAALAARDLRLARLQAERLEPSPQREGLLGQVAALEEEQRLADERLAEAYRRANEERDRAAQAHDQAERLVMFLLKDLHAGLQEVNRLDLLAKVSREALHYFDRNDQRAESATSLHNRAIALRNIGDVFRFQGDQAKAQDAYEQFHAMALRLNAEDEVTRDSRVDLAESHERLGTVFYFQGKLAEAQQHHQCARDVVESLHADDPSDPVVTNLLAHAVHQIGVVHWRRRELDEAKRLQGRSLELFERLVEDHPDEREYLANLGWNLGTFGNIYRDLGRMDEAIKTTERSVAIRGKLARLEPENRGRTDDLNWSITNLALLREYKGDCEGALETYAEAAELRRRLAAEDPTNAQHRNNLGFILSSMGRNYYALARYADAARVLGEAEEITRALASRDPTNARDGGAFALTRAYYANALFALGELEAARALNRETLPDAERVLALVPENGVFQNAVAQSMVLAGLIREADGDTAGARESWLRCLELIDGAEWRRNTSQGVGLYAEVLAFLRRHDEARDAAGIMRERGWMTPRLAQVLEAMPPGTPESR